MSAQRVDTGATHQATSSKFRGGKLQTEPSSKLLKFETTKILGKEVGSVFFRGDKEHIDLLLSYAFTYVVILNINMLRTDLLHRV